MRAGKSDIDDVKKLIKDELGFVRSDLKSIKEVQAYHSKTLGSVVETQEAHTKSLTDIENRIIPLAETVGAVVVEHSERIGKAEERLDGIEPRVDAIETVITK